MAEIFCKECGKPGKLHAGEVSLPCGHEAGFYFPFDRKDRDERTPLERLLWEKIGPPLYYCAQCKRTVKVKAREGEAPEIVRPCGHTGEIIAPRKAVCVGKGGASIGTKARIAWDQAKAAVTGRCA